MENVPVIHAPQHVIDKSHIKTFEEYQTMYKASIEKPDEFFGKFAEDELTWFRKFDYLGKDKKCSSGGFEHGDVAWFPNGKLNAAYNCVDRHVENGLGDKNAILWEGEHTHETRTLTYSELQREVHKMANALRRKGIRKGDCVCIYMPMIPEAIIAVLACAHIGAPHNVVFAGFSVEALHDRIVDGQCKLVITADESRRAKKVIPLKSMVDEALTRSGHIVESVIVYQHTESDRVLKGLQRDRDFLWQDVMQAERPFATHEWMDSEDVLFLLFTSGSTGRPKGIQHSTAGYLLGTMMTHKYVFSINPDDIYFCAASFEWISGHSYLIYGPLLNGATTLVFESIPTFPDAGRYWDLVQRWKISVFYTSPTAIRALMKFGNSFVTKYDRSTLRVLGSVGEPINPEAWKWYYEIVGEKKVAIVDTYWQTETGSHVITPIPGAIPTKPGSATLPFFGVDPILVDEKGNEIVGNNVSGFLCLKNHWPSMCRTIWGDHNRFMHTYLTPYKGLYFTGDGAYRDGDGYYWITGRVDDVINVSGHRIGSAEIESALITHKAVAESAVVGVPHDIKGSALFAYVTVKDGYESCIDSGTIIPELVSAINTEVGPFAKPDYVVLCPNLPKTRSGKIIRRILRKIACKEVDSLGDLSTLADHDVVDDLITRVNEMYEQRKYR
jgi:acetyl-CoA synthetase